MYAIPTSTKPSSAPASPSSASRCERRLDGSLTEDEFRPLRLMNGLYLQLHAYMLRVAIPYGTLNPRQMRQLAISPTRWDKGYGHFTTRQNIQFNWPKLADVPDILSALADVGMHAIQTSGNCVRNVTADHFAGAAADEIEDPRPVAELLRQWSTDHPEFQFLPRKFKIAITGSPNDRAVTRAHDIGLRMVRNAAGRAGVRGDRRRRPGPHADDRPHGAGLPAEGRPAALRRGDPQRLQPLGRRDNKYKARIKITVHETGLEEIRDDRRPLRRDPPRLRRRIDRALLAEIEAAFAPPAFRNAPIDAYDAARKADPPSAPGPTPTCPHRNPLRHRHHQPEGAWRNARRCHLRPDAPDGRSGRTLRPRELRISHEQNVILPHVHKADLPAVMPRWRRRGLPPPMSA
jgi:sulfite reductase (NADPH) hemoprotein beta-component